MSTSSPLRLPSTARRSRSANSSATASRSISSPRFGSITPEGRTLLAIIGRVRCNVIISGGTGSGKTTLLNCLTAFIDDDERVITCEDSAELQLQQPHVVRLETRPPNLEGEGEITMRDLVKNCLRMRPDRIIVGEVRGPEAFDLLQAMNTGHDGSMGTLHSNSPRECISRLESMILMGGYNLPAKSIREMIVSSVDVIVQASRLRDGSRKITHVTEVIGMEGDVVTLQDLFVYEMYGEDANKRLVGRHRGTGIARPHFWDKARYFGEEERLAQALGDERTQGRARPATGSALCSALSLVQLASHRAIGTRHRRGRLCPGDAVPQRRAQGEQTRRDCHARPGKVARPCRPATAAPANAPQAGAGHDQGHRGQREGEEAG